MPSIICLISKRLSVRVWATMIELVIMFSEWSLRHVSPLHLYQIIRDKSISGNKQFTLVLNLWSFLCSNLDVKCKGSPRFHPNSYSLKTYQYMDFFVRKFNLLFLMEYWDIGNIFHCRWRYSLATLEGLLEEKSRDHEERDPHVFCAGIQVGSGFFETEDARIAIREKAEKRWREIGMWGALGKLTESCCDPFTRPGSFRVCANFSTDAKLNHSASGQQRPASRSLQRPQ